MILHKLNLANFRAFEQVEVEFERNLNVIAGVNGVGKTAILDATAVVCSQMFSCAGLSRLSPRTFADDDVFFERGDLSLTAKLSFAGAQYDVTAHRYSEDELRRVRGGLHKAARESQDRKERTKVKRRRAARLEEPTEIRQEEWKFIPEPKTDERDTSNPIAVLFTPGRRFQGTFAKLMVMDLSDRSRAYAAALNERPVEIGEAANWFYTQERLDRRARAAGAARPEMQRRIIENLRAVVPQFMHELDNLRVVPGPKPKFIVEKCGTTLSLGQLSDGERGLLAIVFDITRRLAIANPEMSNPIRDGRGLVLIDEIEIHLHPQWQRQALRRLHSTFKNCQFIVTTHSPQVIGQVAPKQLILLYRDSDDRVQYKRAPQSFGMDSSWILQQIMDAPSRDIDTAKKLRAIWDAIDAEALVKARRLAAALERNIGLFPELQEAKSTLDRIEMLKSYEKNH